jgi:hypothetical protein
MYPTIGAPSNPTRNQRKESFIARPAPKAAARRTSRKGQQALARISAPVLLPLGQANSTSGRARPAGRAEDKL